MYTSFFFKVIFGIILDLQIKCKEITESSCVPFIYLNVHKSLGINLASAPSLMPRMQGHPADVITAMAGSGSTLYAPKGSYGSLALVANVE